MSKSTPGPWRAISSRDDGAGGTWSVYGPHRASAFGGVDILATQLEQADARLIAAAPDLLAALLALQSVSFHQSNCPAFPPGCVMEACECGFDEAEELARAAIAKARGGT